MTIHPAAMINDLQTLLPIGRQPIEIVDAAYEADEAGSAMLLKLQCQAIGGEYEGRTLNIEMALEGRGELDGQRHFAALRRAIGVPNPETTDELRFKPFDAQIGVAKGRNIIRAYGQWGA